MGHSYEATCKSCKHSFEVNEGGGFRFHLLKCDKCGADKAFGLDDLHLDHVEFPREFDKSYLSLLSEPEKREILWTMLRKEDIEEMIGNCSCGGTFLFSASPRCPKCYSTEIDRGEGIALYD